MDTAAPAAAATPKKQAVKFSKPHRHDGVDYAKDDIATFPAKEADLLVNTAKVATTVAA